MPRDAKTHPPVSLVAVDEIALDELVAVATIGAAANEVTPPLTAGDSWTHERVAWLEGFHGQRRDGLTGSVGPFAPTTACCAPSSAGRSKPT